MMSEPGRGRSGDDDLSAEPPAFSDEGMRRIVYGRDRETGPGPGGPRDARSQTFTEDTAELEADLRSRRNLVPIVTALAAVVCFGAIMWYAYTWGTGQMASDDLPVVRAEPMPEKVKPEQPGGMEVPHQGIAVLNNGGTGEAPQAVERLLPRPETPAPPEPLAQPLAEPPAQSAGQVPEQPASELPPEAPLVADGSDADVTGAPDTAENPAPEDGIAKPLPRPDGGAGDQIAELLKGPLETANGDAAKAPAAAPEKAPAPAPVQTAKATAGDVVLQLSSVKSEAAAAQEWKRLQTAHPALLGKLPLALETAAVQGTTYYRVQTGPFASRDAAAEVCTQLKARNQDCLVKQR
jgi:hypothetical protein